MTDHTTQQEKQKYDNNTKGIIIYNKKELYARTRFKTLLPFLARDRAGTKTGCQGGRLCL